MIKRPQPGENEDDILKMQEEFLREKSKNQSLQPAAQVVNLRRLEPTKRPNVSETSNRKPSKYAQSKGLKNHSEKRAKTEDNCGSVLGDILEKSQDQKPEEKQLEPDDDKVYFPRVIPSVMGSIIEKNVDCCVNFEFKLMPSEGFPMASKRDLSIALGNRSIHCQNSDKIKQAQSTHMDVDEPSTSAALFNKLNLPSKSYILSSNDAEDIHSENVQMLSKMSEKEILEEQQKLFSSLDSQLVEFIKSRRKLKENNLVNKVSECVPESNINVKRDTDDKSNTYENDTLWENDVLSHPEVNKWLHFSSLENDKLEWMKGIEESKKVQADEPYEARFDFKGYLLPYTMEYTEATKTLFHHGEESHRPGYSLTELFELSRSAIIQQRVMALNTIAGILEYYNAGTYKDVIEIPLSKIFFVIRIAMDENKVNILEPALKAMRNMLYNRIDEACLDALVGFEEGALQPCLENDKSEIEELESKESDLKDFHLAEIDIIAAVLRTDILQRLFYILDTVRPNHNCVQYCLQILTRLARDSVETANRIVLTDHLMNAIIRNFVPSTSVNFVFDPLFVYKGKPILAALKLLRVLCLQSEEIGTILLSKYNVLEPVSAYISSGVDRSYGLRIQIEANCILTNLLHYGLGTETAISLCPIIITSLYKHVQGTDVFAEASIISATHAAVVLQLVNKLLSCNFNGFDNYKAQIYPLLKEGVQKWIAQISQSVSYTCGHLRLLCSALDCWKTTLVIENITMPMTFLNESLKIFAASKGFGEMIKNLVSSSNLLSKLENKDLHCIKNLMRLGGSVIDSSHKVLPILKVSSPIPFLASLFKLLNFLNDKVLANPFLEYIDAYLGQLADSTPCLCSNWFTRMEIGFLFNIMKLSIQSDISEDKKDMLYAVANKLCYILRIDKRYELDFLFSNIVFNKNWFTTERLLNLINLNDTPGFSKALASINNIKLCYSKVVNLNYKDTGPNICLRKWQEPILPRDWIYLPILMLYSKSQVTETEPRVVGHHAKKVATQVAREKEFIITSSLEWILFNELCFPDLLNDIDVTDRFCRIMCIFLCDNSLFLETNIKILLRKCTQLIFKKKSAFNFDKPLTGLNNFQDFYTQFLEQFQSVSYGDHTFAAFVLVPLAQIHNVKWRKLLWSEYAGCLRALDCPEEDLCYDISEYFYPEEIDETLLKSYFRALSSNLLRPNTIAHQIATHHVNSFKSRSNVAVSSV